MNSNDFYQLAAELNVMDFTKSKPNYADLARKYGMDYRIVKKYHEGYKGKPRNWAKPSRLDQYKELIIEKLSIPRISRKGVYEFLIDQYGDSEIGSYSNFKAYCKKHKLTPSKDAASGGGTRYETDPADMAQCDWKENMILTSRSGETFVVNIFHLVLKFSRFSYIELTLSKEQPVVFRCLINAFKFYGGVPKRILFDNMSTVIDTNVKPKRVNHKMVQFAKDMNFRVESCKARHAYTKGTNEARNKIMDWLRSYSGEFDSIEELQEIVDKLNVKMNTNICQGTGISPCLLFIKEKEYLTPLPDRTVLDGYLSPHKVKVSSQQLVYFNGAQYSVDRKYIEEYVSVETFDDMLQIYYKGKLIQIHTISRNPINYTKKHYEQSISKQLVGNKDFSKVVANNLSIMDKLLDSREIVLTRNDALKSYDHMIAYLVSQESLSFWIKRFIQTLNKEERKTFYIEVSKILPYITDEEQFFSALKKSANKNELNILRVNLWGFNIMDIHNFLSQEGYDLEKLLEAYKNKTGAQKREALAELEAPAYKNRMKRLDDIDKSINKLINAIASKERDAINTVEKLVENRSSDRKQQIKYLDLLGKQNIPLSLSEFQNLKYNDKENWLLLQKYKRSRSSGKLSAFSTFGDYKKYHKIIQDEIVGRTTKDGVVIKSQSDHFIERVLGTTEKESPQKK